MRKGGSTGAGATLALSDNPQFVEALRQAEACRTANSIATRGSVNWIFRRAQYSIASWSLESLKIAMN